MAGVMPRTKHLREDVAYCEHCRRITDCEVVGERLWFNLFFLPLFPIGKEREYRICKSCGAGADFEGTLDSPFGPPDKICNFCGTKNTPDSTFCKHCGNRL